ncbi:glycosyltransferase family 4 protein [Rhodocytophaga aerolata]|uniref:Glycosyltransferase family 4 protein n=1 Tax=Rhodocytophaga aerolata TaxID=455078 RepID=A0ABT8R720_9BACT|nr:glycosyltransferase family 4 protein [Rhodocytophaga aerolata]MDO1447902.1 glycosyltransferase family 4 protein [Rhodocytophaga aerolata]
MKKVLIIQRLLPHYRIDFFNKLRTTLAANGVELSLVYGKDIQSQKNDEADLEWATYIDTQEIKLGNTELYWQPSLPYLPGKDLVIVEQANKNLINYLLLVRRLFSGHKIAYWGHGLNRQANPNDFRNTFKKAFLTRCDWWFAYTSQVKEFLAENGFPRDKITTVQNAIDTTELTNQYNSLTASDAEELKNELGIQSDNIGLYVGGIYKEKRINFLIKAADLIRAQVKDFHLIVVGSGVEASVVKEAASTREWLHYVGPKFGLEKVKYFKIARLFLMPGLLGLAVLDSFAQQTPTVTTNFPFHSPEVEYLENGVNGVMTEDTVERYAYEVSQLMQDEARREQLVEGCKVAAKKYTLTHMVHNYAEGILKCLHLSPVVQLPEINR